MVKKANLSLSSSLSVKNLQHHFARLSMVAESAISLERVDQSEVIPALVSTVAKEVENV